MSRQTYLPSPFPTPDWGNEARLYAGRNKVLLPTWATDATSNSRSKFECRGLAKRDYISAYCIFPARDVGIELASLCVRHKKYNSSQLAAARTFPCPRTSQPLTMPNRARRAGSRLWNSSWKTCKITRNEFTALNHRKGVSQRIPVPWLSKTENTPTAWWHMLGFRRSCGINPPGAQFWAA